MRARLPPLCVPLLLLACVPAPEAQPPRRPAPATTRSPEPRRPEAAIQSRAPEAPQPLDEMALARLLRGHLMQLLPCERRGLTSGQMEVVAELGPDGALLSLRTGDHSVGPETIRCVMSRVTWWRFPESPGERQAVFTVTFPLVPPSIQEHQAVASPGGGGHVDLSAATAELRRLRPRMQGCFPEHRDRESALLLLLSLRLGEWGKLLDFGIETDTPPPAAAGRGDQAQERTCLRKVLRLAEFPNPVGGEVEIHYPYVL